ncbi:hypothetical protein EYC84_009465 [Monilinia fructicola]|uniref:Zn(2)-C6 fungal-type domain-containing protein n=1 Tax=Monilinia fructicola TaxID=38448 RepID=A0A5M9JB81_MONFR|nr:hypothetical protein EYC84_009465 [Monilinia fructicola]
MTSRDPKQATRRPHKKSRYGCKSCKTRRLKCDESKPTCANCTRNGLSCEYLFLPSNRLTSSAPPGKKLPLPTAAMVTRLDARLSRPVPRNPLSFSFPTSTSSSVSDADQLLEFRLFQHFVDITDVSQLFSICNVSLWSIQLACRHRSVMDALLGVSAFHLRSSFSSSSSSFPTTSIYVQDEGMRRYLQEEEVSFRLVLQYETSPEPASDHPTVFNFLFDDLSADAPDYKTYALCTKYLNILGGGKIAKYILKFPALVPPRFVELMKEKDVRTMGIVGYFLMLVRRVDKEKKLWWMEGAVENDWAGMKVTFQRDEIWSKRMEWARREIEDGDFVDFAIGKQLSM